MIVLSRLNGAAFALNPDLIERAESNPDTVITLVDGTKYVVAESIHEIVGLIRDFRASVIAGAQAMEDGTHVSRPHPADGPSRENDHRRGHLVPLPTREG
jgi:flagellar protein FlbD